MIIALLMNAALIAFAVIGICVATFGFFATFIGLGIVLGAVFAVVIALWMLACRLFVVARRRQAVLHD